MTLEEDLKWWWFYCWRCEQWSTDAGPWCELYRSEPLTNACMYDEYLERRGGVPWTPVALDEPGRSPPELPKL